MPNLTEIYETLLARYGDPQWWPTRAGPAVDPAYEIMVGAVLTQNCAWRNVEKALANFGGSLTTDFVLNAGADELIGIIRPAGFFNQKAAYLKAVTAWYGRYNFDAEAVRREPLEKLRSELLSTKGAGRETADSILLYCFNLPTFVIDAYTVRLCERLPLDAGKGYDTMKRYFESNLQASAKVYNTFHALIVLNAKEHCKKKPRCGGCPLEGLCEKRGNAKGC